MAQPQDPRPRAGRSRSESRRAFCALATSLAGLVGSIALAAEPGQIPESQGPGAALARTAVRGAAGYGYRRWLRERIWSPADESRYGLRLDAGWERASAVRDAPLVVVVHGFNSKGERNAGLLEAIGRAGLPCGTLDYPNDWSLDKAAAMMSRRLKELATSHPERRVALVTHSMGGLVARACVENAERDPGNVTRLVMIAPPSQGSALAQFAVATDVWEHWLGRSEGGPWTRCRDAIVDGLGEAADDLTPGSPFLAELNARPRNPRVTYTIVLGTGAGVTEPEMAWLRAAVRETAGRCPGLRDCGAQVDSLLADMDELVDGKGDGVVAVKRGRLEGVDDVVVLPFGHLECTDAAECDAVRDLQREVVARLQGSVFAAGG